MSHVAVVTEVVAVKNDFSNFGVNSEVVACAKELNIAQCSDKHITDGEFEWNFGRSNGCPHFWTAHFECHEHVRSKQVKQKKKHGPKILRQSLMVPTWWRTQLGEGNRFLLGDKDPDAVTPFSGKPGQYKRTSPSRQQEMFPARGVWIPLDLWAAESNKCLN